MYTIKAILYDYENGQTTSSEQVVYSIATQDERPVSTATGSFEISEGGSIQFALAYTHPLYNSLIPLETYISASDDTEEIFYGRILSRSDPTFTGLITYSAEGALSFLRDWDVPPEPKDSKGQQTKRTMTAEAFFRWCIDQYNSGITDARRQFTVGQITIDKKSEEKEYQVTSYMDTRNAIDQYLRNVYGGFLRARRENGTLYIDWLKQFDRLDPQDIEIGVNVQDLNSTLSADGIYTVLRPVGTNGLLLDPETIDLFPPEKMALMGRIVKSVTFNNADTVEKLRQVAENYASRVESVILGETSIKLIDMHYLDGSIPKIRIGDRFDHIHGNEGTEFTVSHMDVDFIHPDNDAFSFKNRKDLEGTLSDGLCGGTLSKATSRGARSAGLGLKYYHESTDQASIFVKQLDITATELLNVIAENAEISAKNYQRTSAALEIESGFVVKEWPEWEPNHLYYVDDQISRRENGKLVGYRCLVEHTSGEEWNDEERAYWEKNETTKDSVKELWGTDVIQNSNQIASVAGNFQVLTDYYDDWPKWFPNHHYVPNNKVKKLVDGKYFGYICVREHTSGTSFDTDRPLYWEEQHGRKSVRLIDGASFTVDDLNGNMVTVAELAGGVDNVSAELEQMVGSALWTQKEHIVGVSGQFNVVTDPDTGLKKIVIVSGGGMTIERNNVQYGLFHEGNLSGGLMVNRINSENWNAWSANTAYYKGSSMKYNDIGYICLTDHISGSAWYAQDAKDIDGQAVISGKREADLWVAATNTKISGDRVDIEARQVRIGSTSTVEQWMTDTDQNIDDLEGIVADKATIAQLNAQKARIDNLDANWIKSQIASINKVDMNIAEADQILGDSITGENIYLSTHGAGPTVYTSLRTGINSIQISGPTNNVYTLQYKTYNDSDWQDAGTFSRATTLTGAWGSGTDADKFIVTASPQGNKYKYSPPLRLNGRTDQSNFSAEVYYADGSSVVPKKSVQGFLVLGGSGTNSYVEVNSKNDGTGSGYARLGVGSVYTSGKTAGVNSVTVSDVSVYGTPAATATEISVQATASNGATKIGSIGITTQRNNAYNSGGATAKVNQSSQTLGYGGSVTVTAQYVNSAGTTVSTSSACTISAPTDANIVEENIKNGVTIFGVTGNYSGPAVTIDASVVGSQSARAGQTAVDNFTSGATRIFSSYTLQKDGSYAQYYKFKVTAGGKTKNYYFKVG